MPVLCGDTTESQIGLFVQVGMQNSTLGALLASVHFADPLTAVPCAISACMHSLIGSAVAAFYRSHGVGHEEAASPF